MNLKTWVKIKFLRKKEKKPSEFGDSYRAVKWILAIVTTFTIIAATAVNIISKESLSYTIYTDIVTIIFVVCAYYISKFTVWLLEKRGIL